MKFLAGIPPKKKFENIMNDFDIVYARGENEGELRKIKVVACGKKRWKRLDLSWNGKISDKLDSFEYL